VSLVETKEQLSLQEAAREVVERVVAPREAYGGLRPAT
jgi:hypothetical protein